MGFAAPTREKLCASHCPGKLNKSSHTLKKKYIYMYYIYIYILFSLILALEVTFLDSLGELLSAQLERAPGKPRSHGPWWGDTSAVLVVFGALPTSSRRFFTILPDFTVTTFSFIWPVFGRYLSFNFYSAPFLLAALPTLHAMVLIDFKYDFIPSFH